jgi:hypothetical protein
MGILHEDACVFLNASEVQTTKYVQERKMYCRRIWGLHKNDTQCMLNKHLSASLILVHYAYIFRLP